MALLKKHFRPAVLWIPLLIFFALPNAFGQEEELVLDNPDAYTEKHRSAVVFPHEMHMEEFECLDCHHDYDTDGENVLDEDLLEEGNEEILCASCHSDLKKAYHRQCMGCHRSSNGQKQTSAPVLCSGCHSGPEIKLVIDNGESYSKKQRAAVSFSHEGHMQTYDCNRCHHDSEPDIRCTECHFSGSDVTNISLKKAHHQQCMGCHRDLRRAGDAVAPELCGECHIK